MEVITGVLSVVLIGFLILTIVIIVCYLLHLFCWFTGICYCTGDILVTLYLDTETDMYTTKRCYVIQYNVFSNPNSIRCVTYHSEKLFIEKIDSEKLHRLKRASFKEKVRNLGEIYEYIQTDEFKNYAERNFE